MRRLLLLFPVFITFCASSQADTSRRLRAFPITDYIVDLNDSVKLVQVELPDELSFAEKQLGLVKGVYDGQTKDTAMKGYGRCQLIKGRYFYFAIGNNKSGQPLKGGDLLYTMMDKTDIYYGMIPQLASHFIRLTDVFDKHFYDRFAVFLSWTPGDEQALLDSMVADIRFTGDYFYENDPSLNKPIISGSYEGRPLLNVMRECRAEDLRDFLDYVLVQPKLYAGREWKLSEIFATWLSNGAPSVKRD